jgi:tetratricopeptide (TPR) repeat protein
MGIRPGLALQAAGHRGIIAPGKQWENMVMNAHRLAACLTALFLALLAAACDGRDKAALAALRATHEQTLADARALQGKHEALSAEHELVQKAKASLADENERLKKETLALQAANKALEEKTVALQQRQPPPETGQPGLSNVPPGDDRARKARDQLVNLAGGMIHQDQYGAARAVLRIATDLGPELALADYQSGVCEGALGNHEEARNLYERALAALEQQPDDRLAVRCLTNYAATLTRLSEPAKAEEAYTKALAIDETYAPAYFNLGLLYARNLNRPQEAIEAFRKHIVHGGERGVTARELIRQLQAAQPKEASP